MPHLSGNLLLQRRHLITLGVGGLLFSGTNAWAAYPDKPIKLIVPWAPGGSTDAIARAMAQRMGETMGKPVIVDNRPGAAGQIGTDAAAKSAPDGYTVTLVELPHAIAPAVVARLPYDLLRDFTPVTMIGTSPLIFFAGTDADSKDFKTFMKAAASKAAPPSIAHSGSGTVSHLAAELLGSLSKIKFNMVPYRGSAPALTDVAAGTLSGHFATLASGASLLSAGKIRPLAVTSSQRMAAPGLKDVPTLAELGIKGMEINQWWAMVAPATTALDVIERLRTEALAALAHPSVRERLSTLGVDLKGSTRNELRAFLRLEAERWQEVARGIGLQPQ
jgi:tripartite-type tricarboxylate transporter receptor subunit TctC